MVDAKDTVSALWKVTKVVLDTLDFNRVTQNVCDSLLVELGYLNLGYRIIVLSLYEEESQGLRRVSLSQTAEAEAAKSVSTIPFHDILIPVTAKENLCVRAYLEQQMYATCDWKDLLSPPLSVEAARVNQKSAGIKCSLVLPVILRGKSIGSLIFSMVKDIDEVTEVEKDLFRGFADIVGISVQNARLYSQLQQAHDKLKELDALKDEFISIASHELRSPAAVVKDYLWTVLNESKELSAEVRSDLEKAVAANQRLVLLVNDLLDVSRIEGGRMELSIKEFDLGELVSEVIAERKYLVENKTSQVKVSADREKTRQVIINLLDNAVKFSGGRGVVRLEMERGSDKVKLLVSDQGIGIDPAQKDKLFSKFGRLDTGGTEVGRISGNGLGLYICKKIVEMSGGEMGYESEYGHGSTFWFTLETV